MTLVEEGPVGLHADVEEWIRHALRAAQYAERGIFPRRGGLLRGTSLLEVYGCVELIMSNIRKIG